jgi:hypothetical protein
MRAPLAEGAERLAWRRSATGRPFHSPPGGTLRGAPHHLPSARHPHSPARRRVQRRLEVGRDPALSHRNRSPGGRSAVPPVSLLRGMAERPWSCDTDLGNRPTGAAPAIQLPGGTHDPFCLLPHPGTDRRSRDRDLSRRFQLGRRGIPRLVRQCDFGRSRRLTSAPPRRASTPVAVSGSFRNAGRPQCWQRWRGPGRPRRNTVLSPRELPAASVGSRRRSS